MNAASPAMQIRSHFQTQSHSGFQEKTDFWGSRAQSGADATEWAKNWKWSICGETSSI